MEEKGGRGKTQLTGSVVVDVIPPIGLCKRFMQVLESGDAYDLRSHYYYIKRGFFLTELVSVRMLRVWLYKVTRISCSLWH
jgi:hypothetical protein